MDCPVGNGSYERMFDRKNRPETGRYDNLPEALRQPNNSASSRGTKRSLQETILGAGIGAKDHSAAPRSCLSPGTVSFDAAVSFDVEDSAVATGCLAGSSSSASQSEQFMGLTGWMDSGLQRCGIEPKPRRITMHYLALLGEQLTAMLPLSVLQVFVLAVFFHKTVSNPATAAAGLFSAVLGLVLFLDGLRLAVMPMAMQVGHHLPQKVPLPVMLLITFWLGVLVTYAEPAIAAIRPLAGLVDPQSAPYLYFILNQKQEITVLSIGLGVGAAAVLGMLKFMYNLPMKALIAGSLLPTIALACYMQWGNPRLAPILGVAWDCGAVTTGPVTVPILIALGVSVMKAQREKQQAFATIEDAAVNRSEGNTLEGFGIVTLASLLPVLAVELMAIIISLTHSYEQVLEEVSQVAVSASTATEPLVNRSPVREVLFAVRAIGPLCTALVLLVVAVLHMPLPVSSFDVHPEGHEAGSTDSQQQQQPAQLRHAALGQAEAGSNSLPRAASNGFLGQLVIREASQTDALSTVVLADTHSHPAGSKPAATTAAAAAGKDAAAVVCPAPRSLSPPAGDDKHPGADAAAVGSSPGSCGTQPHSPESGSCTGGSSRGRRCCVWLREHAALLIGMLMCQVGMILFNLGLTYGFSALSDMTGTWLPTSFLALSYAPGSPYYSVAGGIALTLATVFCLGVLATLAEPALNVLGQTVEELSGRRFSKRLLVWAVAVGVAVGLDVGACTILFSLPLIYFILSKYAAASVLTALTKEAYTAVAWDSAGVTTGPVTVPFVLGIGLSFGRAVGASSGFGLLTCASAAPIISVLVTSLLRKPVQRATSELVRVSTTIARASMERFSRRGDSLAALSTHSVSLWRASNSLGAQQSNNSSSLPRSMPRGQQRSLSSISAPPGKTSTSAAQR